jgi:hypothetical protein
MTATTQPSVLDRPSWADTIGIDTTADMTAIVSSTTPAPIGYDSTTDWDGGHSGQPHLTVHQYDYLTAGPDGVRPDVRETHVDIGTLGFTASQARDLAAQIVAALDRTGG